MKAVQSGLYKHRITFKSQELTLEANISATFHAVKPTNIQKINLVFINILRSVYCQQGQHLLTIRICHGLIASSGHFTVNVGGSGVTHKPEQPM